MAMYWWELISLIIITFFIDLWLYKKIKTSSSNKWISTLSLIPGILFILFFLYVRFGSVYNHNYKFTVVMMWVFLTYIFIYGSKTIYLFFYWINSLYSKKIKRKTLLFKIIGIITIFAFTLIIINGITVTTNNVQLVKKQIYVKNLPPAFNGYKIAIFADAHIGNWNNDRSITNPIIHEINGANPNLIIFAGDMVNNFANELNGWKPYFEQLKAQDGKYAILGNHDYGDYAKWKNDSTKKENLDAIKQNIRNLGFTLMLNEHLNLIKNNDTIILVGVENWQKNAKKNYCNLNMALNHTDPKKMKILLSHNPEEWDKEVKNTHKDIFLTISGHTHAGQIGLIYKKIHFSPIELKFKQWQGLYQSGNQYIYVNRGMGFVGLPLRIGIRPEITIIELKSEN